MPSSRKAVAIMVEPLAAQWTGGAAAAAAAATSSAPLGGDAPRGMSCAGRDDRADLPPPTEATTLARRLCQGVLATVSNVDSGATITSVARWERDSATLVRIRAGSDAGAPLGIVHALKQKWPLAVVSMVENVVEGVTEAQLLVPSMEGQRALARDEAMQSPTVRRLRALTRCVALAAVLSFAVLVTANASR